MRLLKANELGRLACDIIGEVVVEVAWVVTLLQARVSPAWQSAFPGSDLDSRWIPATEKTL